MEGIGLIEAEEYARALEAFDRAVAAKRDYPSAWFFRGLALHYLGRHQETVASFDEALKHKSDYPEAWFLRGMALLDLEKFQEAVASFDEEVKHKEDKPELWLMRGIALTKLAKYQEAVASYDEALRHRPDYPFAWHQRTEALRKLRGWLEDRLPPERSLQLYEAVAATEKRLHLFLCKRLQQTFGEDESGWWAKGVPLSVRQKCAQRREEDPAREPVHNYIDLIDFKEIVDKNSRLFEADFQRVSKESKSKKDFLAHLVRLNEIRKAVMHPVRSAPTEEDIKFAHWMRKVVETFAADMEG